MEIEKEHTRAVLEQYRSGMERELGRLWMAKEAHLATISKIDEEMGRIQQSIDSLVNNVRIESPPIRAAEPPPPAPDETAHPPVSIGSDKGKH